MRRPVGKRRRSSCGYRLRPVLRNPNCAGSAPVMSEKCCPQSGSTGHWPKPGILSGIRARRRCGIVDLRVRRGRGERAKRILRDTRETQHHFQFEIALFALRLRMKPVGADRVTGRTEARVRYRGRCRTPDFGRRRVPPLLCSRAKGRDLADAEAAS